MGFSGDSLKILSSAPGARGSAGQDIFREMPKTKGADTVRPLVFSRSPRQALLRARRVPLPLRALLTLRQRTTGLLFITHEVPQLRREPFGLA